MSYSVVGPSMMAETKSTRPRSTHWTEGAEPPICTQSVSPVPVACHNAGVEVSTHRSPSSFGVMTPTGEPALMKMLIREPPAEIAMYPLPPPRSTAATAVPFARSAADCADPRAVRLTLTLPSLSTPKLSPAPDEARTPSDIQSADVASVACHRPLAPLVSK